MAERLGWGILSAGNIAASQTEDLLGNGFRVVAVGARSADQAQEFASRFGIGTAHEGYEALVEDPEVDIVYVGTPHSHHYRHARLALEAGKHVLLEKSFTVTAEQAEGLARIAEERSLVLLEAMWTRFLPHMVRIREIIEAGTIGDVRTLIADHNQKTSADPRGRMLNPSLAGGALLDLGIYPISFAWDLFGKPSSVQSQSSPTDTGVDRQTAVILSYPEGKQAVLHTALDTLGPNTASVMGTDGWIAIDSVWYTPTSFTVYDSTGAIVEQYSSDVQNRGMQYQAAEVERLIGAGATSGDILPLSKSVQIMRTLDEIRGQIGLDFPPDVVAV